MFLNKGVMGNFPNRHARSSSTVRVLFFGVIQDVGGEVFPVCFPLLTVPASGRDKHRHTNRQEKFRWFEKEVYV